jgi:hypothetical protein
MPCQMARDMLSARLYLSDVRARSGHGQYSQPPCLAYPEPAAVAAQHTDDDDDNTLKVSTQSYLYTVAECCAVSVGY